MFSFCIHTVYETAIEETSFIGPTQIASFIAHLASWSHGLVLLKITESIDYVRNIDQIDLTNFFTWIDNYITTNLSIEM
jgi:hypothetical protein